MSIVLDLDAETRKKINEIIIRAVGDNKEMTAAQIVVIIEPKISALLPKDSIFFFGNLQDIVEKRQKEFLKTWLPYL